MLVPPLAERIRPTKINDIIGQDHLLGENSILRKMVDHQQLSSMIFWGSPGVGKTTIAEVIANEIKKPFYVLNAIQSGIKEIRQVIQNAENEQPIVFIDEIHRFNKSQQDALLSAVEKGVIILIGATTENPSFEVNKALLSRCHVFVLEDLKKENLLNILHRAIQYDQLLKKRHFVVEETEALLALSGGDARKLLNIVDILSSLETGQIIINNQQVKRAVQKNIALYDKNGELHYDIISAFIKSIRGSDPNAAVYWLARMLDAGEDILFIARRMIILASEDIGLANPNALLLANSTFEAVHKIGMPEARIILSQCTIYLATSSKSNSAYLSIDEAMNLVQETGTLPVPLHMRNAPTQLMKDLNYKKDYKYAHDYDNHFVEQEYLPKVISGKKFYAPQDNQKERDIEQFLSLRWKEKYK
ncbi:MAG: replication-associated recombination protein A [Chitinophagaceae bacterium]